MNAAALRAIESTLARGATAATPEAAERVRHAARIVQYAGAAAMSSRVVVLTEALARKFYLAGDAGDIRAWRAAFGLGPGTGGAGRPAGRDVPGRHRTAGTRTSPGTRSGPCCSPRRPPWRRCKHSYTSSAATAWKAAEKIGEAWDSATRTDVLLRHRHLLDGSVVRAQPTAAAPRPGGRGAVPAGADQEGQGGRDAGRRPHPGPRLRHPHRAQHDRRRPHRVVHRAEGAVRSFAMLRDAAAAKHTVLVTAEPFLGSTPRVFGGRWGTRATQPPSDAPTPLRRQVPLDVVLAGGE